MDKRTKRSQKHMFSYHKEDSEKLNIHEESRKSRNPIYKYA